ncbi:hypothetical protein PAPYR_4987 [Paratrimastix pyriformis]|uniref:Uncharacterized protein n=1 Tax=Paratrimastix pyriformis TaxID=342808 RepID=A0ABQ8UN97_9EUKA|nr:hypothetical protein PAPYR_4987 [Paratrimastix pyriformis]
MFVNRGATGGPVLLPPIPRANVIAAATSGAFGAAAENFHYLRAGRVTAFLSGVSKQAMVAGTTAAVVAPIQKAINTVGTRLLGISRLPGLDVIVALTHMGRLAAASAKSGDWVAFREEAASTGAVLALGRVGAVAGTAAMGPLGAVLGGIGGSAPPRAEHEKAPLQVEDFARVPDMTAAYARGYLSEAGVPAEQEEDPIEKLEMLTKLHEIIRIANTLNPPPGSDVPAPADATATTSSATTTGAEEEADQETAPESRPPSDETKKE